MIHLSSMMSIILAARANQRFSFLWRRVADAFLVSLMTCMACSTSSSSPLHTAQLPYIQAELSILSSNVANSSWSYISSSEIQFIYLCFNVLTIFSISLVEMNGAWILIGRLVFGSI